MRAAEQNVDGSRGSAAPAPAAAPRRSLFLSSLLVVALPALFAGGGAFLLGRQGGDAGALALTGLIVAGLAVAGARLQERSVGRTVRALAARADQVTALHSGRVPLPGRAELGNLVRSFDAMAAALHSTIERTRAALDAEMQETVDLQRRYALMQLLRNLASLGNEGAAPEPALQEALAEIGTYLDWPVGRLTILAGTPGERPAAAATHWYVADAARFDAFVAACGASPAAGRDAGMLDMALDSTLSHWVTDLARLDGWAPLAAAQAAGLRSGFVVPVALAPGRTAVLEFFADHRIDASAEMLELVEAISVELWRSAARLAVTGVRTADAPTRRLAQVAERLAEAVLVTGADGRVAWTNPALHRLLGLDAEQCLGRDAPQLLFARDAASAQACRRALESGDAVTGLVLRTHGSAAGPEGGAERTFEIEIASLPEPALPGGAAAAPARTGHFLLVRDITHDRATQDALNAALEAARQASQSKSQFLANMSHEIRTPMNGVLGMAELLLGTALDERQRRYIESLYRSGEALLEILNDILDFSKIEAGKLELQAVDFDLHALLDDLIELLAPRAHQKRIELAYRLAPDLPQVVHGDPTRLRQVLINVVGNAIKFTEHGEVVLGVEPLACESGPPGAARAHRLRFEVRDTGIGMPPEAVDRLFTTFMQADPSSSRRYGGTGLGLAISRQLTELMHGRISAQSRVGEGSTFRIDLPLREAIGPAPARADGALADLAQRRVLIVEDNPTNRGILEEQLRRAGMDCASAGNGRQALQRLREAARMHCPFELAVVDMKMPIMDGLTLVESVRQEPLLRDLRLVMLTSISGRDDARRAQELGVEAYLSKPVRQQELLACLANALQRRAAAGATNAPARPPAELAGRRILVVEDNLVNQEVARAMLDHFGCSATLVGDGAAALELLARECFDVILMDCQMPVLDGFETLRRLRAPAAAAEDAHHPLQVARRTPVIALTANALSGDAERCRAAGFSDYLAKPFRQEELARMLATWVRAQADALAGQGAGGAADPAAPRPDAEMPLLDAGVLEQIRAMEGNGAPDLMRRLVQVYGSSSAELVSAGARALEQGDAAALEQCLHTLKSSSASLGALRLARSCAELGVLARRADLAEAGARWPALHAEYERALEALRALGPGRRLADAPVAAR
jgi:signal transduction histidine kinase/DNA-binding response OmpR family regulator/HPt (histidine-containing phosphotransfer) domain-containing protein